LRYPWTLEREGREPRGGLDTADALKEILRSEDLPGVMPPDWLVATLRMDQDDEGVSIHSSPLGWTVAEGASRPHVRAPLGRRRRRCGRRRARQRHLSRSYPRRKRPPVANCTCLLMFPQVIHGVSTCYPQRNLWPLHRILSMRSICGSHSTRRLRQPGLFLLPRIPSRVSSPTPFFSAGGGPRRARRRTETVPAALCRTQSNARCDRFNHQGSVSAGINL